MATGAILLPALAVAALAVWWTMSGGQSNNDDPLADNGSGESRQVATDPSHSARQVDPKDVWETGAGQAESWNVLDNPEADGWDTEVYTTKVTERLDKLKKIIVSDKEIQAEGMDNLVVADADVGSLLPGDLDTVFEDKVLRVRRGAPTVPVSVNSDADQQGALALASEVRQLIDAFNDRENLRVKFKVFSIEKADNHISTRQSVEIYGKTEQGLLEINSVWSATWDVQSKYPRIKTLACDQFESVDRFGKPLFSDCTTSILGDNPSFKQQVLKGYNHWLERSQVHRFLSIMATPGVAVGDINGDGLEDLYFCQEDGLPNLLYLQNQDGSLRDISAESGTNFLQNSSMAIFADLNNDGHQDLAVAVMGGVVVMEGNGQGGFQIRSVLDTDNHLMVLNACDYDMDGKLDLYAAAYYPEGIADDSQDVIPGSGGQFGDANDGGRNSLFRSQVAGDDWQFEDVTQQIGMDVNNRRYTLAAAWEDYDNDGDQDLYVANDYGVNNLYRNDLQEDGSRMFVDIAKEVGAEDNAFGMSVAWGDYDRDGWMDLYISNMFSYAGNRITTQKLFKAGSSEDAKERFRRFARGNTLLRNLGQSTESDSPSVQFEDLSLQDKVNMGRWAWGSNFLDINNDGWDDIVVANGYLSTGNSGDL